MQAMAPVEMGPRAPERQGQGLETVPEMARVPVRREPVQGLLELVPGLLEPVRGRREPVRAQDPAQVRAQDQVPDQEVDQDQAAAQARVVDLVQVQVPALVRGLDQVPDQDQAAGQARGLVQVQVQEVDQDREAVLVLVQVPDRGQAQVRDREAGRVQDREVGRVQDREVALVPDQVQDRVPGRPRRPKHTTAHSAPPAEDVLLADLAARHAGSSRLSTVIYASSPDIIRPDWYPVAARLKARCPPWQARREVPQNFQALLRSSSRLFHRDRL